MQIKLTVLSVSPTSYVQRCLCWLYPIFSVFFVVVDVVVVCLFVFVLFVCCVSFLFSVIGLFIRLTEL